MSGSRDPNDSPGDLVQKWLNEASPGMPPEDSLASGDSMRGIHRLFDEGKPFYTVDRFLDIESKLSSLDLSAEPCQVELQGIDGQPVTISVGLDRPYQPNMYPVLGFKPYERMRRIVHHRRFDKKARDEIMCNILLRAASPQSAANLMDAAHWEVEFSKAIDGWAKNPEHNKPFSILDRCNLSSITKIICFGLRDFHQDLLSTVKRSLLHHAAALTVARQLRDKTKKHIPLFTQDPPYCDGSKEVLKNPGFQVYERAARFTRGFIDIDKNTLVMSIFSTAPVREIIVDFNFRPTILICDGLAGEI
ncbi:hypothetical protein DL769_010792 [Monosporascus sp. CRB-8-3]|nr:hypothetical protein DL769_010792 [Monosporascus sp. CRB-8-3]